MLGMLIKNMLKTLFTKGGLEEPIPDLDYGFDDVQVWVCIGPKAVEQEFKDQFSLRLKIAMVELRKRCVKYRTRYWLAINKQWFKNEFLTMRIPIKSQESIFTTMSL
mmetsp:Transcript_1201/g.1321  ORF Transcript_1201/g.1321 Transcript_1201/m.1321 type:complete len:107 (+) Transcript_1201:32-352(+)